MCELSILYQDNHLLAVNKPAGIPVQRSPSGAVCLEDMVKTYIKEHFNKHGNVYLGVPHRIDQRVSGIVLFAKTSKALTRLCSMFKNGEVQKTYWAVVSPPPANKEAMLTHYIIRSAKYNKSYAHALPCSNAKQAILRYKIIASGQRYCLLEINLLTGRHHQIRCQLSALGSPIKGDLKYGAIRSNPSGSISLHARSMTLVHPIQLTTISLIAPAPTDDIFSTLIG
jgi:23S rRNA pseudouridine1911/1915/1917 synthase